MLRYLFSVGLLVFAPDIALADDGERVVVLPALELPMLAEDTPDLVRAVSSCLEVLAVGFGAPEDHRYDNQTEQFGQYQSSAYQHARPLDAQTEEFGYACMVEHDGWLDHSDILAVLALFDRAFVDDDAWHRDVEDDDVHRYRLAIAGLASEARISISYDTYLGCGTPRSLPNFRFSATTFPRYVDPNETGGVLTPVICF